MSEICSPAAVLGVEAHKVRIRFVSGTGGIFCNRWQIHG